MSSVSAAKPFVKRACLTKQFHSPAYFHRVGRPVRVMCTGRSNAKLLKEIRQVSKDVQALRTEVSKDVQALRTEVSKDVQALSTNVSEVRTELKVLEARVTTAVVVNVGAYLAPVLGFAALANSLGFLDKLKLPGS